jgi:hypothetical protein
VAVKVHAAQPQTSGTELLGFRHQLLITGDRRLGASKQTHARH